MAVAVSHTLDDLPQRLSAKIAAKVADTTAKVQVAWVEAAQQISKSGEYARSIQAQYPVEGDPFRGQVFSTAPYAAALEYGTSARDMKPSLLASPKAKTSKSGGRYLIIPFRHGVPGSQGLPAMPQSIYAQARKLEHYGASKAHLGPSPWGQRTQLPVGQTRLPSGLLVGGQPGPYTWKTGLYSGMVRAGTPRHSQYITFRVVSSHSDPASWWYPGFSARHIRQNALNSLQLPPGLGIG